MPKEKYVPKHRNAPVKRARPQISLPQVSLPQVSLPQFSRPQVRIAPGIRNAALISGVAVAATGVAISAGVAISDGATTSAVASSAGTPVTKLTDGELAERVQRASRSSGDRSAGVDASKVKELSDQSGVAKAGVKDLSSADPKTIAQALMPQFGFSSSQFSCLESLWTKESGWNPRADNPTSSAYGIPQALPGSKMSSAGPDWEYNPETQIRWGLGYIQDRYGSPCSAWGHSQANNWY